MSGSTQSPKHTVDDPINAHTVESGTLRVELLGGFRLAAGKAEIPPSAWRSHNAAQIVKRLALAPGYMLHRDLLADLLWPDTDSASAANNLRQGLHIARRYLQELPLDQTLVLRSINERVHLYPPERVSTDVHEFELAARAAFGSRDPDRYWAAAERFTGVLLPNDLYEEWTSQCRDELAAIYGAILAEVARLHETRNEHPRAIEALRKLVAAEPSNEATHAALMRLYAAQGKRSQALLQYQHLTSILISTLDIEPEPGIHQLYLDIKNGTFPSQSSESKSSSIATATTPASNLPVPVTTFLGRKQELAHLIEAITEHRLVTLVGPGGIGKTRLAFEAGRGLVGRYADGVWLVDLSGLDDAELVPQSVAAALGVDLDERAEPSKVLADALSGRELLLVLDNCEHLIDACAALVQRLLHSCSKLSIVATSREALRVRGERRWPVAPLPVPTPTDSLLHIARNDAVRLFVDRVRWHQTNFNVAEENAPAICDICRRLDGIPLALELAAARADVLTPEQLTTRLENTLDLLTAGYRESAPRQQTLRGALDWSYQLLSGEEQLVFRRLAVFSGGWTLGMAESICSGGDIAAQEVVRLLSLLSEKSLLQADVSGDEARYRLLEPVRQFANERLQASGEVEIVRERHAHRYLALAEEAEPHLTGPSQALWLNRVAREQDNLRAALVFFDTSGDRGSALRLAGALGRFWWTQGFIAEGQRWLSRTLQATKGEHGAERMKAVNAAFTMAHRRGEYAAARSLAQECLKLAQQHDDRSGMGWALTQLGMVAAETGGDQQALLEQSLEIFREIGDTRGTAEVLNMLGEIKRAQGDDYVASQLYEESLVLWQSLGDEQYIATVLHNLGRVAEHREDSQRAASLLLDSLTRFQDLHINNGVALCLRGLAGVAVARDQPEVASRFLGAAEVIAERTGVVEDSADRAQTQSAVAAAQTGLDDAIFAEAWSAGKALSMDAVIREAHDFVGQLRAKRDITR